MVCIGTLQKDLVLNGDGMEFTRADPKKGELRGFMVLRNNLKTVSFSLRLPQPNYRGMKKFFPGVRTHGIAKHRFVCTLLEAIGASILLICVANGKIGY